MIKANFKVKLLSGNMITYDDLISLFDVYYYHKRDTVYFLIPKQQQSDFVLIVSNSTGVRIVDGITWLRGMVYDILTVIQCNHTNSGIFYHIENVSTIPQEVKSVICPKIVKNPVVNKYIESMLHNNE